MARKTQELYSYQFRESKEERQSCSDVRRPLQERGLIFDYRKRIKRFYTLMLEKKSRRDHRRKDRKKGEERCGSHYALCDSYPRRSAD